MRYNRTYITDVLVLFGDKTVRQSLWVITRTLYTRSQTPPPPTLPPLDEEGTHVTISVGDEPTDLMAPGHVTDIYCGECKRLALTVDASNARAGDEIATSMLTWGDGHEALTGEYLYCPYCVRKLW